MDASPDLVGLDDCDSLLTYLENRRMDSEKYLARRVLPIQTALGQSEMANSFWLPGPENPAGVSTK